MFLQPWTPNMYKPKISIHSSKCSPTFIHIWSEPVCFCVSEHLVALLKPSVWIRDDDVTQVNGLHMMFLLILYSDVLFLYGGLISEGYFCSAWNRMNKSLLLNMKHICGTESDLLGRVFLLQLSACLIFKKYLLIVSHCVFWYFFVRKLHRLWKHALCGSSASVMLISSTHEINKFLYGASSQWLFNDSALFSLITEYLFVFMLMLSHFYFFLNFM